MATDAGGRARKVAGGVAKLALVAGLLWLLARNGLLSAEQTARALAAWQWTGTGMALVFATALIAAWRWHGLLVAQDIRVGLGRVVQMVLVGVFFNIALPGSVTGDLVKGYYLTREAPGREARAAGTILLDRILGVAALALVCAAAQLLRSGPALEGGAQALQIFVLGLAAAVTVGIAYLLAVPEGADVLLTVLTAATRRVPRLGVLREFYLGMRHYHSQRAAFLWALALSVLNHVAVGLAVVCFVRALGLSISALDVYATAPPGLLVTTVPVGPAGVGTGHAAFAFLFRLLGTDRGADVYTLIVLGQVLTGAVGGLIYLRFRAADRAPTT